MKIRKYFVVAILLTTILSCKKDKADSADDCGIPELKMVASVDLANPCGIAVSPGGKVAITEFKQPYGSVGLTKIWNSYSDLMTKKAPAQIFQNTGAEAIAFDNNENLYVTETEQTAGIKVYKKITAGGADTYQYLRILQGGFSNPRGISFDSKNRLFLADDGNDRLLRFDDPLNSNASKVVAAIFGNLKGLAIAGDTIYITGYNRNVLYKSPITNAGGLGESAMVSLNKPVDVAVHGTMVAIAAPESATISLLNSAQIQGAAEAFAGCRKEIKGSGPLYGLAFVKTDKGFGLLSAQHAQNKIMLYEPQ